MQISWNLVNILLLVGTIVASAEAKYRSTSVLGETTKVLSSPTPIYTSTIAETATLFPSTTKRRSTITTKNAFCANRLVSGKWIVEGNCQRVRVDQVFQELKMKVKVGQGMVTQQIHRTTTFTTSNAASSTTDDSTSASLPSTSTRPTATTPNIDYSSWSAASNNRLYKLFETMLSFTNAQKKCEGYAAILASEGMRNATLRSEILNILDIKSPKMLWIGLSDLNVEGNWTWEDGKREPIDSENWQPRQPDNAWTGEDCAHLGRASDMADWTKFNDNICSENYFPLCETK